MKMNDMKLLEIKTFCDWFVENNRNVIFESFSNSLNDRDKTVEYFDLYSTIYANIFNNFCSGKIRFNYSYNHDNGKFILNLSHLNKKSLIEVTSIVKEKLSQELGANWIINISK